MRQSHGVRGGLTSTGTWGRPRRYVQHVTRTRDLYTEHDRPFSSPRQKACCTWMEGRWLNETEETPPFIQELLFLVVNFPYCWPSYPSGCAPSDYSIIYMLRMLQSSQSSRQIYVPLSEQNSQFWQQMRLNPWRFVLWQPFTMDLFTITIIGRM